MKVWVVGVSNCEENYTVVICSTKEIAEKKLFEERDRLIKEWREMKIFTEKRQQEFVEEQAKQGIHVGGFTFNKKNIYEQMIENLSSNDYKKWDNYPHDVPYLYETEVL